MSLRTMGLAAVVCVIAFPAMAEEAGRYQLERSDNGFVRLDTVTGEMSLCRETGDGLSCETARDDVADLRRERDRLRDENRDLRRENEDMHRELDTRGDYSSDDLPSDEEMEHMASWFERMMTIMMRTMRHVDEEMNCDPNAEDCDNRDRNGN